MPSVSQFEKKTKSIQISKLLLVHFSPSCWFKQGKILKRWDCVHIRNAAVIICCSFRLYFYSKHDLKVIWMSGHFHTRTVQGTQFDWVGNAGTCRTCIWFDSLPHCTVLKRTNLSFTSSHPHVWGPRTTDTSCTNLGLSCPLCVQFTNVLLSDVYCPSPVWPPAPSMKPWRIRVQRFCARTT